MSEPREITKEDHHRLKKARLQLMVDPKNTFLATLMLQLNVQLSWSVPTAATNGLSIWINPDFFEKRCDTDGKRMFLLEHELWHVVYDHMGLTKMMNWDPRIANCAQDYHINAMLVYDMKREMIEGGLLEEKYHNWSSVKIYEDLMQNPDLVPENLLDGDVVQAGGMGEGTGTGCGKSGEITERIKDMVAKAMSAAHMADAVEHIPNEIREHIKNMLSPELPWNVLLQNYFAERIQNDYSWAKRNRRFRDVYMPGLDGEGMGEIRVYRDGSGSISQDELALQAAECRYIKELVNPSRMILRDFSHYLGKEQCFDREQEFVAECDANGGTDFRLVFDDIGKNEDTEVAIIFTDGLDTVPPLETLGGTDLIWVIVNNKGWVCPYGFPTLHMEIKN